MRELTPHQRSGMLVWDAMKLPEGFVSNVFTGETQGFEWDGTESFDHLSHSMAAMDKEAEGSESERTTAAAAATGTTPGTGAAAPATAAAPARKKKALTNYWTEFFPLQIRRNDQLYLLCFPNRHGRSLGSRHPPDVDENNRCVGC